MQASFVRRSAALIYDALLLVAVFFVITAVAVSLNEGEKVSSAGLRFVFLLTAYVFYTWFWLHGGQTLGMRAWRLRLVDANGRAPTWSAVSVRFLVAIGSWTACGLGHVWILIDVHRRAWHDRVSRTFVIYDADHNARSNHPSH